MRNLRWAAELAVSADAAKARLGIQQLQALRDSRILRPDDEEIIYAALQAAIEVPLRQIKQSTEGFESNVETDPDGTE
jgi:hypothetical protein